MTRVKKLLRSSFGKAIIMLTSGSLIAQIITLLAAPLLTRIYSPKELGVYALILTAESLFGGVVCARYDVSIVSETDEKKIYPLIKLSFIFCFFVSLVASIGYACYFYFNSSKFGEYNYAILFIFVLLLATGSIKILESYNNRFKEYKIMTTVYIFRTSLQNFGSIFLGLLNVSVFGLLLSHTLGLLVGLRKQAETLIPHLKKVFSSSNREMKVVMRNHYRQPIFSAPAVFANRFSYSSIALFIESLFGLNTLGYYWISYKVLGLPLSVLSNNVAKVFFQEASREYDNTGRFIRSFKKTSIILTTIAIPMVLCMFFLSPYAFRIVFGDGWSEAGKYVQILAPMFGIRFIVNTIAYGLQISKKQSMELILQFVFVGASILCYFITKQVNFNIQEYLMSVSISFSIIYIIYYFYVLNSAYGDNTVR